MWRHALAVPSSCMGRSDLAFLFEIDSGCLLEVGLTVIGIHSSDSNRIRILF